MIKIADVRAYNVQEAAELLDVSPQTIRSYIKQGKLKAQKAGNNTYKGRKGKARSLRN